MQVSGLFGSSQVPAFSVGDIGDTDRANITAWFKAHGVANPSDADILTRLYDIAWERSRAR
jgi:hypothetical protein